MSAAPLPTRHMLLTGPPGVGKSTLAPRLAAYLGVEHTDLDAALEIRFGASVAEQWVRDGEPTFRGRERAELCRLLSKPGPLVIALGGGALLDRSFRHQMLAECTVLSLSASADTLHRRLQASGSQARPLLVGDALAVRAALDALLEARADIYAEAHAVVSTDQREDDALAALARIATAADMLVPLGARSYPVHISQGNMEAELDAWCTRAQARVALWVVDDGAYKHHGPRFERAAAMSGARLIQVRGGEGSKHMGSVEALWREFADAGLSRSGVVAIAGGGAVLDSAAFAASCWHRGTAHLLVPTTLMGMADAAVGGKTGVNLGAGKNIIGSTWQPRAVFVDCTFLSTNPPEKWRTDQAELLKAAALGDGALAAQLCAFQLPGPAQLRRALRVKVGLVVADEQDRGERALLNFGHTVGHALEVLSGFTLPHGAAVAAGMRMELQAMVRLGHCEPLVFAEFEALLSGLGFGANFMTVAPSLSELQRAMAGDKKSEGGSLRLCTLKRVGLGALVYVAIPDFFDALRFRASE